MGENRTPGDTSCGQAVAIILLLFWLGIVPPGVMFVTGRALSEVASPGMVATVAVVVVAMLLLPLFVGAALLTRRQAGWGTTAAVAAGGAASVGYLLLGATVEAIFLDTPNLYGERAWAAALRLVLLVPYVLIAAWLIPRLAGANRRSPLAWLGLKRFDWPASLLALAVAALVAIPWPVTGALGDSLTSLSLAFQTLVEVVPAALLFWGVVFSLLTSTFARPWTAALATILIYGLSVLGGVLPAANWGALASSVTLLPLAFLLTELRARQAGIYPLLSVAFCYHIAPRLFVDPRDVLARQGIPNLEHILSHTIVLVTVAVTGPVLWGGRQLLLALRDRVRVPAWVWPSAAALAALVLWGVWSGLYVFAGEPGFANDGFLVILEEQADLGPAYAIPDREARLQYVRDALIETAERTQVSLRAELDALGVGYRPYYVINMIRVDGHRWLTGRLEDQAGVAQVILNPNVRVYPFHVPEPYGEDKWPVGSVQANLAAIHADEAWALGVTGEGIVVAGQDTGYDWAHPALKPHYRGWDGQSADHDTNWHDAWDDTGVPFDDDSHGTHTMGTVVGDDGAGNRTGVAPGAQWIGCRNMRRGYGNPGSYAECMEFFLAPHPHGGDAFSDGDVGLAPHVVNNSWYCPEWEGCFPGTLEPAVEALRAAGIMMIVSAGNEGPACGTVGVPANYDAAFSVGATDDDGDIVGFSSRGPVDGLLKPDVTAPGFGVRSSVPGGYGYAEGTSMAGPHVAGLVALLWSADPALIGDVDATEDLICRTAAPRPVENVCTLEDGDEMPEEPFAALLSNVVCACGDVTGVPNNVYGCGFIDAEAAVRAALDVAE
jgi:subtilisin family serine protease